MRFLGYNWYEYVGASAIVLLSVMQFGYAVGLAGFLACSAWLLWRGRNDGTHGPNK